MRRSHHQVGQACVGDSKVPAAGPSATGRGYGNIAGSRVGGNDGRDLGVGVHNIDRVSTVEFDSRGSIEIRARDDHVCVCRPIRRTETRYAGRRWIGKIVYFGAECGGNGPGQCSEEIQTSFKLDLMR